MAYDLGLAERIRVELQRHGEFSERKMFGGIAFMVNGNMSCGVVKTDLMLRLTNELAAEALREPHTRPMDFSGKPMKSMVYVEPAGIDSDMALEKWLKLAAAAARKLPSKAPAKKKAKAAK